MVDLLCCCELQVRQSIMVAEEEAAHFRVVRKQREKKRKGPGRMSRDILQRQFLQLGLISYFSSPLNNTIKL
jgi:hypothetical protein